MKIETLEQAKAIFGSVPEIAEACGFTRQAPYQWPDKLTDRISDRLVGAAVRTGRLKLAKSKK